MGTPASELEEIAVLQAARIKQLEAYIQGERRTAASRALNGNVPQGGTPAGSQHAPQAPAPAANNERQAGVGLTTILMPQIGQGVHAPPIAMPYLQRHQLRNYPYAGARIL